VSRPVLEGMGPTLGTRTDAGRGTSRSIRVKASLCQ
jgi:hypothetical protein